MKRVILFLLVFSMFFVLGCSKVDNIDSSKVSSDIGSSDSDISESNETVSNEIESKQPESSKIDSIKTESKEPLDNVISWPFDIGSEIKLPDDNWE